MTVFTLESASFVRAGGAIALRDITWTVREGETWAIFGPSGSGKTALADVIVGRHHLQSGSMQWPLLDRLRAEGRKINWPAEVIRQVSFKEDSHLFSYGRHFYQQRFNFIEPHEDLTLDVFLRSGAEASDAERVAICEQLGIGDLLHLSLIKLSNGQVRRARMARALLARPEWLILDEPLMGLDESGREEVVKLLGNLVHSGTRILLITRPESVPEWVSHVLELDRQTIRRQGKKDDFGFQISDSRLPEGVPTDSGCPESVGAPLLDRVSNLQSEICNLKSQTPQIEMYHVNVDYGGQPILRDVSWTVNAGERWAVLGPNGSGKTTLLSLICGDHPQAYSNDIRLFGTQRGSGESIWEIKRRIGLVSPELHLYYSEPLTAAQTAATGFFDVMAYRPITSGQVAVVRELFDYFAIAALAVRPFAQLSTGEQRLVLLIRALVKDPDVVILDEPFQALDDRMIGRTQEWIDSRLRGDQSLIHVSHYEEEIPRTVTRRLRLENGRVVQMA